MVETLRCPIYIPYGFSAFYKQKNGDEMLIKTFKNTSVLMLLFLLSNGCNNDQPTKTKTETETETEPDTETETDTTTTLKTKTLENYFSKICTFTYEANKSKTYSGMLDNYIKNDPEGKNVILQKRNLIERYIELFDSNYDADIQGSILKIFKSDTIPEKDLLNIDLPPIAKSSIKFEITNKGYDYKTNEAYVDFANRRIGGGALLGGFVQEEIEMLESTFFPWLTEVPLHDDTKTSVSFCPSVNLKNLDKAPIVLRFRLPFHWHSTVYGNIKAAKRNDLIRRVSKPDIYAIALAAINYEATKPLRPYELADVTQMTIAATRAFLDTMVAMHQDKNPIVIHTGNWGAGVFKGNVHTVWTMQALAVMAAYEYFQAMVKDSPEVRFIYEAFNDVGHQKATDANARLTKVTTTKKLRAHIDDLLNHIKNNPSWQTGK